MIEKAKWGWRDLYEGVAWLDSGFRRNDGEIDGASILIVESSDTYRYVCRAPLVAINDQCRQSSVNSPGFDDARDVRGPESNLRGGYLIDRRQAKGG